MTTTLDIRPLDPERDLDSLLATWSIVFGEQRSRDDWARRFLANPAGLRAFVACDGERVVAQYAGAPLRVWVDGRAETFTQSVDSLVHPDYRRGLKKPGLFVQLAREYFDHYGVHGDDAVHYGWPLDAAWRIGKRFLDYGCVREELALVRELAGDAPPAIAGDVEVAPVEPVGDELRWLWERSCGSWGAGAVRDADFYAWRFAELPGVRYRLLGARDAQGTLRGLAVLRRGDWLAPGTRALVDWLVPEEEEDVARSLEVAVCASAREDGGARLATWLPDWSRHFARFQDHGWRVHPTPYRLAARAFDRRFDPLFLREAWWATLADSDLA